MLPSAVTILYDLNVGTKILDNSLYMTLFVFDVCIWKPPILT